jgi:4-amino-4-deoxy-L-arabinose transferase-like glycosyltransferase
MKTASSTLAILMLASMFILAFASSWNDSVIFDETAHVGAGYSYLTQQDMRLNPEHPPLIKDLAAFPLLFLDLNFPTDTDAWQKMVNGQWDQGGPFLFEFGNDPDTIMHYARAPIMLLAVLLGALLFYWVRKKYGAPTALLTLFFYCFSPTVLAHSRFVTTDIGAAFAFFTGITTFLWFLERPDKKRIFAAGLVFGLAQLIKFSLFLLVPIFFILAFVWIIAHGIRIISKQTFLLFAKILLIFVIGALLVWIVYAWHVWDYPQERQLSEAQTLIGGFKVKAFVDLDLWLIEHTYTRPLGEYLLGVMMVTQRTAGGNSAYFLGQVSASGWKIYFPTVYLLKETLGFHILTLIAFFTGLAGIWRARNKSAHAVKEWLRDNFPIFTSLFFVAFYWASSIANPLNIGIRHVLPTFPFLYFLVAYGIVGWIRPVQGKINFGLRHFLEKLYLTFIKPIPKLAFVIIILAWIGIEILITFPAYLSYYNELAGGTKNGHWYATDSNYDWGQDLKRLADMVKNPSGKVYLDYFGGSTAHNGAQRHWLGGQYVPWYSSFGPPPSGSLFAVSANSIRGAQARPVNGFPASKPEDTYPWLSNLEPIGRAGTSIFLYRMP